MPNKFALFDGNFHSSGANSIWYSASATTAPANGVQVDPPTSVDTAIANGRTVTITQDVNCIELTNGFQYGWNNFGGGFIADTTTNNINIRATIRGTQDAPSLVAALSAIGTNTLNLSGTIRVPTSSTRNTSTVVGYSVWNRMSSGGTLAIYGNVDWSIVGTGTSYDSKGGYGVVLQGSGVTNIYGAVGVGTTTGQYFNESMVCILANSNSTLNIYGSVGHPTLNYAAGRRCRNIYVNSNCTINVFGDVLPQNGDAICRTFQVNGSSNTITINGNVYQAWDSSDTGFDFETASSINNNLIVNGSVIAANGGVSIYCIRSLSTSPTNTITINGNVYSAYAPAINSVGANLFINGNVVCGGDWPTIYIDPAGTGVVTVNGNIIDSNNTGVPAILTNFLRIKSTSYQPYILRPSSPVILNQPQTDEIYYYPIDAFSQFSLPSVSSVRAGVTFADKALTGICVMPPVSNVYYGVPFDTNGNSVGTATIGPVNLFDFNLSVYDNQPGTLGHRLANVATSDELGHFIGSLG
jgi:hypothetical protein